MSERKPFPPFFSKGGQGGFDLGAHKSPLPRTALIPFEKKGEFTHFALRKSPLLIPDPGVQIRIKEVDEEIVQ